MSLRSPFMIFILGIGLMLLDGCTRTPPARLYMLSAVHSSGGDMTTAVERPSLVVGVGPVEIPSYVDRLQIVTQSSPNQYHLAEFDRWAEPLDVNITRVLTKNLFAQLAGDQTTVLPWDGALKVNYRVRVDVTEFDFDQSGEVSLGAHWIILGGDDPDVRVVKNSQFRESSSPNDYPKMVAAMNNNLGNLSQEIAEVFKGVLRQDSKM